ncbi:MAG TPA: cytochrome P450 [Caulobacteraceae bacterium]|nr:cytochrome P450 [Caulobacteraceae bacterium]
MFRSEEPRFLRTDEGHLVVFRHADLRALSVLSEIGCLPPATLVGRRLEEGETLQSSPTAWVFANQFFFANEPIHAPLRRIMLDHFGPKPTLGFEALARAAVRELLEGLEDGAKIDLMRDLTGPLMASFWGRLIGLTVAEIDQLALAVREMTPVNLFRWTPEQRRALDGVFTAYWKVLEEGGARTLAAGGNPTVSGLAAELAKVHYPDDPNLAGVVPANVGAFLAGNIFDGLHTAGLGAANTLFVLLRRPEAMAQVRAHPVRLAAAVSEALRLEPPIVSLHRFALEDVTYDGFRIPKGMRLRMMWGAGNRDPSAFPDPDRFDLDRPHHGLTTFGSGTRICPGRFAASMVIRTLLEGLLEEGVDMEPLAESEDWWEGTQTAELKAFPVRVRRRGASERGS